MLRPAVLVVAVVAIATLMAGRTVGTAEAAISLQQLRIALAHGTTRKGIHPRMLQLASLDETASIRRPGGHCDRRRGEENESR